jgi:hypothetical protein
MNTFTDGDFIGRALYVSTNSRQVAGCLIPVCIHMVKNKKNLERLLKDLELEGETVASMQWGRLCV